MLDTINMLHTLPCGGTPFVNHHLKNCHLSFSYSGSIEQDAPIVRINGQNVAVVIIYM